MVIDDNPLEQEAMALFKKGETKEAHKKQDAFLAQVKASGVDHCSCPAPCKHHGHCVDCVTLHRGHGDHLPRCFHDMVNRRIGDLARLTERDLDGRSNGDS